MASAARGDCNTTSAGGVEGDPAVCPKSRTSSTRFGCSCTRVNRHAALLAVPFVVIVSGYRIVWTGGPTSHTSHLQSCNSHDSHTTQSTRARLVPH